MAGALLLAAVLAESPAPVLPTVPTSSPLAELITVTLAGIAACITALAGVQSLRKRRRAENDAAAIAVVDAENNPARLRERLRALESTLDAIVEAKLRDRTTTLEARFAGLTERIVDLEERMDLRRAADVLAEAELAPRRRQARPRKAPPT